MRLMLKSKIHRAIVTSTNLDYDGSITIDEDLMKAVDILPHEKVEVMNVNTGARFETYAIGGEGGEICLNGACARLGVVGDKLIILAYEITSDQHCYPIPKMVSVDKNNSWR